MTSNADMKTTVKRPLRIVLSVCGILLLLFVIAGVIILSCGVRPLTIEAGDAMPEERDFVRFPFAPLSCRTDLQDGALTAVGEHTVEFTFLGIPCHTTLTVQDTTPPRFRVKDHGVRLGDEVSWEDFVLDLTEFSDYTAALTAPENLDAPGEYPVAIRITDAQGNVTEQGASLFAFALPDVLPIEAGSDAYTCAERLEMAVPHATFAEDVDTSRVGEITSYILLDGFLLPLRLHVQDTTPPIAHTIHVKIPTGLEQPLLPTDFLAGIVDASEVRAEYERTPDFRTPGSRGLTLILTDASGNTSRVRCRLTVLDPAADDPVIPQDSGLPVIHGVKKLKMNVGTWISYTSGITARDADGNALTVKVDSSAVQRNIPGTYTITYTATDKKGRVGVARTTVTVCEITKETLKPYVDKVLGKILKKDMTQREQARAIYDWMIANVSYTAYTSKEYWMRAAYSGFVNGRGDCYVYYAMSRALLDGAGIENMEICRDNPAKPHFWNLVNCGDGWYHFDTCPHYKNYPLESFMLTDREVEEYSNNCVEDYYSFDASLYPATP